jgi:hypothetical protein
MAEHPPVPLVVLSALRVESVLELALAQPASPRLAY